MAKAFDEDGQELGPEIFGEDFKEALKKCQDAHPDAAKILLRKVAFDEMRGPKTLEERVAELEKQVKRLSGDRNTHSG